MLVTADCSKICPLHADRFGFSQCQIERVDMAAALVEQGADVAIARDQLAHTLGIEQLQLVVAPLLPAGVLGFELVQLLLGLGSKDAPLLQIALDVVALDPLADDLAPFKQHGTEQPGLIRRAVRFYGLDVAAVGVDDLAAVAAAGAKTDPGRLEHHHLVALLHQMQGAGEAGIARPDDADIALQLLGQCRVGRVFIGAGCVVTVYMFGHDPCFLTGSVAKLLPRLKTGRGMGADDATGLPRRIAEAVGLAGVDHIAVARLQRITLARHRQDHRSLQHGADLLPLMGHLTAGVGAGGIGFQHKAELAAVVAVMHQLEETP